MKNKTVGYPAPFQATFDREKLAFLNLANRGDGLTPINYIFSREGDFEFINTGSIIAGTAEINIIYSGTTFASSLVQTPVIQLSSNNINYVGFKAGILTSDIIWTLPLQDGTNGQVLSTDGNKILSWIANGGGAPIDATYILQTPNDMLASAQALNALKPGIMYLADVGDNSESTGVVSTIGLTEGYLYIGNSDNLPAATQKIALDNLPSLTATSETDGQIYRGTTDGIPKVSDALTVVESDISAINDRLRTAQFVLATAVSQLSSSQVLGDLTTGIVKNITVTGKLSIAEPGVDYATEDEVTHLQSEIDGLDGTVHDILNTISNIASAVTSLGNLLSGILNEISTIAIASGEVAGLYAAIAATSFVTLSPSILFPLNNFTDLGATINSTGGTGFLHVNYNSASFIPPSDSYATLYTYDLVRKVTFTTSSSNGLSVGAPTSGSDVSGGIGVNLYANLNSTLESLSYLPSTGSISSLVELNNQGNYIITQTPSGLTSIGFGTANAASTPPTYTTTITPATDPLMNVTFALPPSNGNNSNFLQTDGYGNTNWAQLPPTPIVPSNTTTDAIVLWGNAYGSSFINSPVIVDPSSGDISTSGNITTSNLYATNTISTVELVSIDSQPLYLQTVNATTPIIISASSVDLLNIPLKFHNGFGINSNYVGFRAPTSAINTSIAWVLPAADGSSGQVLSTNGSGTLGWENNEPGTVTAITAGTGLTTIYPPTTSEGGTITTSGTISIADTGVTSGEYNMSNINVNEQGQVTSVSSGVSATGELGTYQVVLWGNSDGSSLINSLVTIGLDSPDNTTDMTGDIITPGSITVGTTIIAGSPIPIGSSIAAGSTITAGIAGAAATNTPGAFAVITNTGGSHIDVSTYIDYYGNISTLGGLAIGDNNPLPNSMASGYYFTAGSSDNENYRASIDTQGNVRCGASLFINTQETISGGAVVLNVNDSGTTIDSSNNLGLLGNVTLGGQLLMLSEQGSLTGNYVGFKAPDTGPLSTIVWVLPNVDGASGQVLSTDGSAILSWVTVPSTAPVLPTGVYNLANITVNAQGQISAISSAAPSFTSLVDALSQRVASLEKQVLSLNLDKL